MIKLSFKIHEHQCSNPEILNEIQLAELKLESLINRYRVIVFMLFVVADLIFHFITHSFPVGAILMSLPFILLALFGLYKLQKLTQCGRPLPALKYISIIIDYAIITIAIHQINGLIIKGGYLEISQILILGSIMLIIVNLFSALRIQKKVIVFSNVLGMAINIVFFCYYQQPFLITFYTTFFIFISGVFNQFISHYIFDFYRINSELNRSNQSLKNANEEIKSQNDELESQNNYLAEQRDKINYQNQQITSSIEYAKRIQQAILPSQTELLEVLNDGFMIYQPKDIVSGDFYWVKKKENLKYYVVADGTGHGVPGGFMSVLGTSFVSATVAENPMASAAELLNELRRKVKVQLHQTKYQTEVKDGMDMALCILNTHTNEMQFAGANSGILLVRKNSENVNEIVEIKPDKMPVGVHLKEFDTFTNHTLSLNTGDLFYMITDGFADQIGGLTGEKFKKRRLRELLVSIADQECVEQQRIIENTLTEWKSGFEQIDDITLMGVRI